MMGLCWACAGCGGGPASAPGPKPAKPEAPLRIAAASDLQLVLPRLIEAFETTREIAVTPTFGASGNLAEQIRQGAPYDVFLSADMAFARKLEDEGAIEPGSVQPYARGSLALVVHPAAADLIDELADLAKPEVGKVAIANPMFAPYGRAAREVLERAELWRELESKIVLAESVRQALVYEAHGDADAALVSRSLIDAHPDPSSLPETVGDKVIEIPPSHHAPLIQGLGIVARSRARDQARAFVDFVLGGEGRLILEESGFEPPEVEK